MRPEGQSFKNPLARPEIDEANRPSEFEPDMPRWSKIFKRTPDSGQYGQGHLEGRCCRREGGILDVGAFKGSST